ncbi:SbcC/MukB-like Walker B domain-containing protein [Clostridium senegalense]|uniref:SbcC/MukB-like Walker B domain-containing protein n=1 Tax=Clostridium senegalense TaxID=1465809 RepID=UPI000288AF86|nr:SbcC/MukB-like Walker B domain-containing protein [Clostridium senegalense]
MIEEVVITLKSETNNMKEKLMHLKELLNDKKQLEYKMSLLDDLDKLFKGKKFVEFVAYHQLKYVSLEASKRLKEITNGNYGLEVDDNGKFIIRDYKNGGSQRDASTLSGGETFLVSLSLALALSAQIQLKGIAPLELFFLDEGFGTLDDELLDIVMCSLEKIHNEKLSVGIISHVESIKNRVPVKLILTPAQSGLGGSKVKIERS